MEQFLYDICLFRWAKIGPIYFGNLLMVILFLGGPMLFAWLNQKGYNIVEIAIWSFKYIISYVVDLFLNYIFNNANLRNKTIIIMLLSLFIPNDIIRFIIILILSFIIINQNIEYKKKNYIKEYKFGKKTYFFIYIGILIILLFILKYPLFIIAVPPLIVIIHIFYWYWFKSKK
mgnify:CR=1 FL=1